jgi:predicted Rossmann fold nucleotide-binding protein DprA/Smf involved in DNA uptake
LKLGASPLTSAADVLSCFGIEAKPDVARVEGTAAQLLELLRESPASAVELVRRAGLDAGEVGRALVELELAGLAAAADGVYRAVGV